MKLYSNIFILFCIWFLAVVGVFYFGFNLFPHTDLFKGDLFASFANWDGGHYIGIANGYDEAFQYAFFPLYPIAISLVSEITHSFLVAGVLISVVSAFLTACLFYSLCKLDYESQVSFQIVENWLLFPAAFFLVTVYSEGLFCLLVLGTFFFARKNKLLLATCLASLTGATRLVGLVLVLAFLFEVISTQGFNRKNWFIIFAPFGFLIYAAFLYQNTGDPLYFLIAEGHWQREVGFPGMGIFNLLKNITTPGFIGSHSMDFLNFIFTVFGLGLIIRGWRFLRPSYVIYATFSIVIPLFTATLNGMPRFLLPIFPIFIVLGLIKNERVLFAYKLFSILLLALFAALFITGQWVS